MPKMQVVLTRGPCNLPTYDVSCHTTLPNCRSPWRGLLTSQHQPTDYNDVDTEFDFTDANYDRVRPDTGALQQSQAAGSRLTTATLRQTCALIQGAYH